MCVCVCAGRCWACRDVREVGRSRTVGPTGAKGMARVCACDAGAGMFSFGNGKYEEAAELYGQAAKQYQLGKNCESSPALRSIREPH